MAKQASSRTAAAIPACNSWVVKLDDANRIEIPVAVVDQVKWLDKAKSSETSIPVKVVPLKELPGVEVMPISEDRLENQIRQLEDQSLLSEADSQQLQRLLAGRWEVKIEVRKKSYRMTLPKEARKLSLLPDFPGVALIYAHKNRLEVWTETHWLKNLLKSKALLSDKMNELLGDAIEGSDTS